MILEILIDEMAARLPGVTFQVESEPNSKISFEPIYPGFGRLEVIDDGDELTVIAGNFTHDHFTCYDEKLSDEEKAKEIAIEAIEFLSDTFSDKIVFWGGHNRSGGWYGIAQDGGKVDPKYGENQAVWSGPIRADGG